MYERRKDMRPEEKIGWYTRYWAAEGKSIEDT